MHSAKGHIVIDERWRLELAVAAVCRSLAPRPADSVATMLVAQEPCSAGIGVDAEADVRAYRAISYYTYRYL